MQLLFPVLVMVLATGASVVYGMTGDWPRAFFWIFTVGLNLVVLMMK